MISLQLDAASSSCARTSDRLSAPDMKNPHFHDKGQGQVAKESRQGDWTLRGIRESWSL